MRRPSLDAEARAVWRAADVSGLAGPVTTPRFRSSGDDQTLFDRIRLENTTVPFGPAEGCASRVVPNVRRSGGPALRPKGSSGSDQTCSRSENRTRASRQLSGPIE